MWWYHHCDSAVAVEGTHSPPPGGNVKGQVGGNGSGGTGSVGSPGTLTCPLTGHFPCAHRPNSHWTHPRAIGRGEGRIKFFYMLNSLTEQILILSLWTYYKCLECPRAPPLTNTQTDAIDTQVRHAAELGISTALSRCLPSASTSHRRPPRLLPWKAQAS